MNASFLAYIKQDNAVYGFGYAQYGALANSNKAVQTPTKIFSTTEEIDSIIMGDNHTAILQNGKIYTAGYGAFGQLGRPNEQNTTFLPTLPIAPIIRIFSINNSTFCLDAKHVIRKLDMAGSKTMEELGLVPSTGMPKIEHMFGGISSAISIDVQGVA